jgi:hypothetical protein
MPDALTDVGREKRGAKEIGALGLISMRDLKGLEADYPPVETCGALDSQMPMLNKVRLGLGGSQL